MRSDYVPCISMRNTCLKELIPLTIIQLFDAFDIQRIDETL